MSIETHAPMAKSPTNSTIETVGKEEESSFQYMRKLPIFRGVSADAISKLLDLATERFIVQGDYIFRQNDPASSLVIFNKGMAVEFKQVDNVDCLLNYYSEPTVLGESSFLESCNRSTTLFANEDCWVTEIDNRIFESMSFVNSELYETLYLNIGRELGRKVLATHEKLNQANKLRLIREETLNWSLG